MTLAPVAVLYAERRTHYRDLALEVFDADRDARTYRGSLPVVAHPPCGPWAKLRHFCKHDDASHAFHALAMVRMYCGVLEHPAGSKLWHEAALPPPDSLFPDDFGGRSYTIQQGDFGHRAQKLTWLYAVGLGPCPFPVPSLRPGVVVVEHMGRAERCRTPYELASSLVSWAATGGRQ